MHTQNYNYREDKLLLILLIDKKSDISGRL